MRNPEILIVDDSPRFRLFLATALPRHGFAVCQAASGEEAVEVYRARGASIDLVLLDVRMLGLDGPSTLAALRKLNPDVRCCFMTASREDYTPEVLRALGGLAVIPKRFGTPVGIARALWEVLGAGPPSAIA
jgi:CheY-like chemotaxis protein